MSYTTHCLFIINRLESGLMKTKVNERMLVIKTATSATTIVILS